VPAGRKAVNHVNSYIVFTCLRVLPRQGFWGQCLASMPHA
jgi:hypothetical protein